MNWAQPWGNFQQHLQPQFCAPEQLASFGKRAFKSLGLPRDLGDCVVNSLETHLFQEKVFPIPLHEQSWELIGRQHTTWQEL